MKAASVGQQCQQDVGRTTLSWGLAVLLLLLVGFAIIIFMLQQSRSDALGLSKETARELDHLKNQLGSLMATGAEEAKAQLAINQSQLTKAPFSFPRAQHSGEVLIFLKFPKVAGSTINEVIAAAASMLLESISCPSSNAAASQTWSL